MRKKFVRTMWGILLSVIVISVLSFIAIWNGWIGYMPDVEDLQNPISRSATQIFSSDGKIIGTWSYDKENRIIVGYKDIAPTVIQALVATEDERFYEHSGIDFVALGRAIVKRGMLGQTNAGGGSTITQQLAKQLYSEHATNSFARLLQKPIEWVIAIKLERNYTKEEIIALYLNYFDFLHNAVGIKTASNTYFSKEPSKLTLTEGALLVGLCKNPSYFNPVRYPERCKERRNVVLQQMVKTGYLTQAEYNEASAEPITLHFHRADHKEGPAPYFREFLRRYMMAKKPEKGDYPSWNIAQYSIDSAAWVKDPLYGWCNKNFKKNGDNYNIYEDGLRIYTTVDTRMQRYAEEAVHKHLYEKLQPHFDKECEGKPNAPFSSRITKEDADRIMARTMTQSARWATMRHAGFSEAEIKKSFYQAIPMTIYSQNGEIDTVMTPMDSIRYYKHFLRAGFMSMDPVTGHVKAYVGGLDFKYFMYDMCSTGRRQVGSSIKPYLYSLAMENGMTPCDAVPNKSAYPNWHVRGGGGGGMLPLRNALEHSNNCAATQLMWRFSKDGKAFVDWLHRFGINTPNQAPNPTMCLGSCEISLEEMVAAYTAFPNHGIRVEPIFVSKITDSEGNVIAEFQPRLVEVMSSTAADYMVYMMQLVVNGGTGSRLRGYGIRGQVGAKTGTTNNNSDGWFMAYTPQLVSGAWVGGEDRDIHFASGAWGQGASMALPIWAYYMKAVYDDPTLGYSPMATFDFPQDFKPCGDPLPKGIWGTGPLYGPGMGLPAEEGADAGGEVVEEVNLDEVYE